ncbi:MAG: SDR family NAD(P)-dependent oxidoreductase [Actinomycetota bacterium]|nr:SDR family NAD(P)-dependent oxidoreductase [Actinomycetota bacterium]
MEASGNGTIAIVTGGGRGIGRAVALALADAGHPVCVDDTGVALDGSSPHAGPAEAVAAEIGSAGHSAMATVTDARTRQGAEELVAEVEAWAGRPPTVLVHSAGTLGDAMIHKASDHDVAEVLDSHLGVALELSRAMAGAIRSTGWGRIRVSATKCPAVISRRASGRGAPPSLVSVAVALVTSLANRPPGRGSGAELVGARCARIDHEPHGVGAGALDLVHRPPSRQGQGSAGGERDEGGGKAHDSR